MFIRERYLSLRLFADLGEIIDGCCDAWNRLTAEPGRIASLTDCPTCGRSGFHEASIIRATVPLIG